jgi:uncharacterized protein (TIGR03083 family)
MVDVWSTIHGERSALAADLEGLSDEQWSSKSLCTDWSVRDVLAHMTATATITPVGFVGQFISSGFSLTKLQAKGMASVQGSSPADTLSHFKAAAGSSQHPPGPKESWLGETMVHSEDIRRPLGMKHDYPPDAAVQVADFYRKSNLIIGGKRRVDGLKLRATDVDWSGGDGPEVAGPILSLLLAISGRRQAIDDLEGEGVATLKARP